MPEFIARKFNILVIRADCSGEIGAAKRSIWRLRKEGPCGATVGFAAAAPGRFDKVVAVNPAVGAAVTFDKLGTTEVVIPLDSVKWVWVCIFGNSNIGLCESAALPAFTIAPERPPCAHKGYAKNSNNADNVNNRFIKYMLVRFLL